LIQVIVKLFETKRLTILVHGDRKNFLFESGEDSYPKLHDNENITKGNFLSPQYRQTGGALKEISGAKQIIQHTHLLKIEKDLPINRINRNEVSNNHFE